MTGGSGFAGTHLRAALARARPDVRLWLGSSLKNTGAKHPWIAMDLTDRNAVDQAVASVKPDLVIHLAAQPSVAMAAGEAAATWAINAGGAIALAASLAQHVPEVTV